MAGPCGGRSEMKDPLSRRWVLLGALFIFLASFLPRAADLDRFVTIDEPRWLARSANFYFGLSKGDFFATMQAKHPGVTTMWAGAAGFALRYPQYLQTQTGQLVGLTSVEPFLRARGVQPIEVLAAARLFVALFISLMLAAAFIPAVRLLGFWPALFATLLIAFDPFHLAHSRFLQLDGLVSSAMLLSLIAGLAFVLQGKRTSDALLSGFGAALAWLTRSPAFFLIPFLGLLAMVAVIADWRRGSFRRALGAWWKELLFWGVAAGVTFVALWPALWVHPRYSLLKVLGEAFSAASRGHDAPTFFNGAVYSGDPGWLFYPLTWLWRATPVAVIGVVLALGGMLAGRLRWRDHDLRRPALWLTLFALLFALFMSLGAKKFDRYLLPVYAPLDIVAALGWLNVLEWIGRRKGKGSLRQVRGLRLAVPAAALALIAVQFLGSTATRPYYLSYYNPLMGGARKAPQVMMIGWGEGLDQAAAYLNAKPDAEQLDAISWYASGPFDYFFDGHAATLHSYTREIEDVLAHDYAVIYIHQWQRRLPSEEVLTYFEARTPEHIVEIDGLEYARIYDLRGLEGEGG